VKVRTTLTIDDEVLKAVRIKAARTGRREGAVIEESLRRDLGLDLLEDLWSTATLDEDEAMELALEAQRFARGES
jgi:plasmid stability protein